MSFPEWLRTNSEHYLMCDAQDRVAKNKGFNQPKKPLGLKDIFWRLIFVPIYRALPWGVRQSTMQVLPGSHRQSWPKKIDRPRRPAL